MEVPYKCKATIQDLPKKLPFQKKLLIFDMDETIIHCVDDCDQDPCDVILEMDFPS